VVPLAHDQFDNGARVEALGVGLSLPATRLSTRRLLGRLEELLDDEGMAGRCRVVAANFKRDPGVEQVVAALETLAR
jgi:rhamnosyltransferase subunit B